VKIGSYLIPHCVRLRPLRRRRAPPRFPQRAADGSGLSPPKANRSQKRKKKILADSNIYDPT
jgi:hypothetical protein